MAMSRWPLLTTMLLAAVVLIAVAVLRSAEYDEQYTLFLTGSVARPVWPTGVITAGQVRALQVPRIDIAAIAHDLRASDVHPPLYFWLAAIWRELLGGSLLLARMASVLCSLMALALVARISRRCGIPVVPAILLTLGCYGFAYTGAIARGFALAQMLSLAGVALLLAAGNRRGHLVIAGMLLGAASFTNYLAGFVAAAALLWTLVTRSPANPRWLALLWTSTGFALWVPADLWFFLAQRGSRTGQFAPFDLTSAVARLAAFAVATVFGGIPLYLSDFAGRAIGAALALLFLALLAVTIWRWRCIGTRCARRLFAMATAVPPLGLLVLGALFNNTPIELRYLAFVVPFVALLLASAAPAALRHAVLAVQAVALAGLMLRPETMQPARATAAAAAMLVRDGVVLVPRGNDGVGIVGAFAIEAPPALRLLVIAPDDTPAAIRARAAGFPRVVLALLGQDWSSRSVLPVMRDAFADRCWRAAGEAFNVLAFDRICAASQPNG